MLRRLGARPRPTRPVDRLVRRRGEHQQLVPLVREQSRVHLKNRHRKTNRLNDLDVMKYLDGQLGVERQPLGPLHQLVNNRVADLAELVAKLRLAIQQFVQLFKTKSYSAGCSKMR